MIRTPSVTRRHFLHLSAAAAAGVVLAPRGAHAADARVEILIERTHRPGDRRSLRTLRRASRRRRLRRRLGRRKVEGPQYGRHPPGADRSHAPPAAGRHPLAGRLLCRQLRLARRHRQRGPASDAHELLGGRTVDAQAAGRPLETGSQHVRHERVREAVPPGRRRAVFRGEPAQPAGEGFLPVDRILQRPRRHEHAREHAGRRG